MEEERATLSRCLLLVPFSFEMQRKGSQSQKGDSTPADEDESLVLGSGFSELLRGTSSSLRLLAWIVIDCSLVFLGWLTISTPRHYEQTALAVGLASLFLYELARKKLTLDFRPEYVMATLACLFPLFFCRAFFHLSFEQLVLGFEGFVLLVMVSCSYKGSLKRELLWDVATLPNVFFCAALYLECSIELVASWLEAGTLIPRIYESSPNIAFFTFVCLYYAFYRQRDHEYIISGLFKEDKYGIVMLSVFAKAYSVWFITRQEITEKHLLQIVLLLLIFMFNTDDDPSRASVHVLMVGFYSFQMLFFFDWNPLTFCY